METVDFKTLLNTNATPAPKAPIVTIKFEDTEPRKEGMKPSAFELLKALLTENQPLKSDLSLVVSEHLSPPVTPPVTSPVAVVPNLDLPVSTPLKEESSFDFTNTLHSNVSFDMLLDEGTDSINPFESLIQPEVALDNGDVAEIEPSNDGPLIASIELLDSLSYSNPPVAPVKSAFSKSYIEDTDSFSVISSEPSSPDFATIDASQFSDSDYSPVSSVKSSRVSEKDFTKLKTKSKKDKFRSSPYDSDGDNVHEKKQRKKMQNKNAATRYRVKKRIEKESLQEQEVNLSDKNKELREKVESLQREIKYMKELMNEINKAKQRKI